MNKTTKTLFLCSLISFVSTLILEFSPQYNQVLFIVRHSSLYLGMAFFISAVLSIIYYKYKSIFIKRKINILYLNIVTLVVLAVSLIYVADVRLNYISNNDTPQYINEILYDEYNNKIYESLLTGIKPEVEVIEKTKNKLLLHIEEHCDCEQNPYTIEDVYPDETLDHYVEGSAAIFVDIMVLYNENHTIVNYTIEETRNITFEPSGLQPYHGYTSRKMEIINEYTNNRFTATYRDYYYATLLSETEFQDYPVNDHYVFTIDQAETSYYRLYKALDENQLDIYIMEFQKLKGEVNELAVLRQSEDGDGNLLIEYAESENRLQPTSTTSLDHVQSNLGGYFLLSDKHIQYYESYDEANIERGYGHHIVERTYQQSGTKYILTKDGISIDDHARSNMSINTYGTLFSNTEYVEILWRTENAIADLTNLENPFETNHTKLYEIKPQEYGLSVAYFENIPHYSVYRQHENSSLMLIVNFDDVHILPCSSPIFWVNYFNYYPKFFQDDYFVTTIHENNAMLNFIINDN